MTVKIMQAQMAVVTDEKAAVEKVRALCEIASAEKADMLCLPEMFCCPYISSAFPTYAQEAGGSLWTALSDLARTYGIYLSAGSVPERTKDGCIYNTAYVFDGQGNEIARHRKMHLFDIDVKGGQTFKESDTLSAGNEVVVFDTSFGKVGICICYDVRFPELIRLMALKGAGIVLVPAAFNHTTGPLHWELAFRSQAMYNQVFMVGTSSALDESASYHSWGHTMLADPWGRVIQQMGKEEGYIISEIDLSMLDQVREQIPLLKHRRTDIYSLDLKK